MALLQQLTLWSSTLGDVVFGSKQAAAIGASFGNGAATAGGNALNPLQMGDDGNLVVQTASAGVSPSATGADKILALATIPAAGFDIANRGISIIAAGNCPNANSKSIKIIVNPTSPVLGATVSGGTTIASILTSTATGGWQLAANLFKYGAAGSNTQIALHESGQIGPTVASPHSSGTDDISGKCLNSCRCHGNSSTTNGDVVFNFLQLFAQN